MTVQGIGASLSNVVAGWLTNQGGYSLAYWVHGGVAVSRWRSHLRPRGDRAGDIEHSRMRTTLS